MTKRTKENPSPFNVFDRLGEKTEDKLDHLSGLLHALSGTVEGGMLDTMTEETVGKALRLAVELADEASELLEQLRKHCSPHLGGVTAAELKAIVRDAKRAEQADTP